MTTEGWTLNQLVQGLELAGLTALSTFTGAVAANGSTTHSLVAAGIAAGVAASYSLVKSLGLGTATAPVTLTQAKTASYNQMLAGNVAPRSAVRPVEPSTAPAPVAGTLPPIAP